MPPLLSGPAGAGGIRLAARRRLAGARVALRRAARCGSIVGGQRAGLGPRGVDRAMASSVAFAIASTALSHVGSVRRHNEDACLERPDIGLWVVADGMGGHQAGDVASHLIIDSLSDMTPPADAVGF